jgi:hypothetical protein
MRQTSFLNRHWRVMLATSAIVLVLGYVGSQDHQDEQAEAEKYCEMVKIWKDTKGQSGWPAYDGESQCKTKKN